MGRHHRCRCGRGGRGDRPRPRRHRPHDIAVTVPRRTTGRHHPGSRRMGSATLTQTNAGSKVPASCHRSEPPRQRPLLPGVAPRSDGETRSDRDLRPGARPSPCGPGSPPRTSPRSPSPNRLRTATRLPAGGAHPGRTYQEIKNWGRTSPQASPLRKVGAQSESHWTQREIAGSSLIASLVRLT